jgi:hypothetical protein
VLNHTLPDHTPVTLEKRPDLLGGLTALRCGELLAIPYYAWAHRGKGEMAVWMKR